MGRRLLLTTFVALLLVAPAAAQPRTLWPGVTYDTAVQFTSNGPVALNVLIGPRPGGTTTLAPVLSNEALTGTETLTTMQRRLAGSATTAGVNGACVEVQRVRASAATKITEKANKKAKKKKEGFVMPTQCGPATKIARGRQRGWQAEPASPK